MPLVRDILLLALALCGLVLLVYWSVGLHRFFETMRRLPTARKGLELGVSGDPPPGVCVIVPAHNEAGPIRGLIESLRDQDFPRLRVVLCLDRCTDTTAAEARSAIGDDERFEMLELGSCPPDWAGKVHAIWHGVTRSRSAADADLLLFADADTRFDPRCIRACVALVQDRGLDMLSLLSTLTHDRWFERIVQPTAGMELIQQFPLLRANRDIDRRAFANGQFMLFRREAYQLVGGHEAVKDELLEDLALARSLGRHNLRTGVLIADGLLTCRMYSTWGEFRRGWRRIYAEGARLRPGRLARGAWRVRAMGAILPLAAAAGAGAGLGTPGPIGWSVAAICGAGLLAWLVLHGAVLRSGHGSVWLAPCALIGAWCVGGIMGEAAHDLRRGVPTEWGGRKYVREPR